MVKIEQPGTGDPMRAYEPKIGDSSAFTWVTDRNKRSVELNLREDPRGAAERSPRPPTRSSRASGRA